MFNIYIIVLHLYLNIYLSSFNILCNMNLFIIYYQMLDYNNQKYY